MNQQRRGVPVITENFPVLLRNEFILLFLDRLVGLVVKASASRAEGPGFESSGRPDFFGIESYQ